FTALDKDGNEVKLSDLIGKPMVLNFWASWCPPCKGEMPHFNAVYEELSEDVTFVMVDVVSGRETVEKGKKHIEDSGFTFPVYYDMDAQAALTYGASALPTTYFVDKDGYVITGAKGPIDEETLRLGISMAKGEPQP
ncbi:MAG: TlpA disulfide reductase family protein, partial [Oscillospiraceae bacterium]